MTKIKKILLIFIFSIFVFSLGNYANAEISDEKIQEFIEKYSKAKAEELDTIAKALKITPQFIWIDLSKFKYFDPDSDDFFGSSAKFADQLKWSGNNDPHYKVKAKIPEINNWDDAADFINSDIVNDAMKTVTDSIYGMTLLRVQTLKDLKKTRFSPANNKNLDAKLKKHNCESVSKVRSDISTWLNKIDAASADDDDTLPLNTNYTYYTCYDIFYRAYMEEIGQTPKAGDILFLAGMTSSKKSTNGFLDKTISAYQSHFKSIIKEGVDTKFNTKTVKDLTKKDIYKFATGACYQIMPKGTGNNCATVIAGDCKISKTVLFVHGITCERLNTLFSNSDSTANIAGEESRAEKDRIKVKFQVPFGDVKDGITLPEYINAIYKYLLSFGLVLSGILLAIGGFQYIVGKPGEGKTMIINSITGIILLSSVYLILQTINPATLNLPEIGISETARDAAGATTMLNSTGIIVPKQWYALKNTDDPLGFNIPTPSDLTSLKTEKIWNTHYYTLFYTGSETKQGIYKYPMTTKKDKKTGEFKTILWTNWQAWCATSMEGSGIFVVGNKVMPIHTSNNYCGMKNSKAGFAKTKKATWKGTMDKTLVGNKCSAEPPVKQNGGETPTCTWWYSHTNSLWQSFSLKSASGIFGGAGRTGGKLIPLRSVAVVSSYKSVLNKFISTHGLPNNKHNLLIYIPDAKGKQFKAPSGKMITHDGYFWVSDYGGLTGTSTSYKVDTDGTTKTKVDVTRQIDMFSGTLRQKILDGNLHNVYIISCRTEPGKSICNKFYQQQKKGYPGVERK